MADQFLTLKDVAARAGTDDLVGLIENVVNKAPEIDRVMGRPIPGISYLARVRTAIGSNGAFRKANSGVVTSASHIDQKRFNTFFFDYQKRLDQPVLEAAEAEGDSIGKVIAEEDSGAVLATSLALGKQFYMGTTNDALGCPGLIDFLTTQQSVIDSRTGNVISQVVDASGTAAGNCENVWFIHMSPQGVHWLFGKGRGMINRPWIWQQVTSQDSAGKAMAMVSNLSLWVGTSMADVHAVGAILNVDATTSLTTHPLTDALVAALWAKFPIGLKPNIAFASQKAIASLQIARTVTLFANAERAGQDNSGAAANIAPWPTNLPTAGGIPIVPTDSIPLGNQNTVNVV